MKVELCKIQRTSTDEGLGKGHLHSNQGKINFADTDNQMHIRF